jgi:hypothetical protein
MRMKTMRMKMMRRETMRDDGFFGHLATGLEYSMAYALF